MTFTIPSLLDTVRRTRLGFRSELKGSDASIWPNNLYVTAKVVGGAVSSLFKRLDIVRADIHAHTAGLDGVLQHAIEFGLAQKPAAPAAGTITIVTSGPSTIAKGATFVRSDGALFLAAIAYTTIGTETFSIPVSAAVAGLAGNTAADADLDPGDNTSGAIESAVVVSPGLTGGADPEDIDTSLRARVLFRKRNPIHGGAPADYVTWASEVPGVTRVFVARRPAGRGTVAVYPMMDDDRPNGIPLDADIARIADHVALYAPSDAEVFVLAATPFPINVAAQDILPATGAVKAAAQQEIADMIARRGRVSGTDEGHPSLPFLTTPLTMSASWFDQAISEAEGEERHIMLAPLSDVVVPNGCIPVLGTVTFA
ncbi:baseplate J/gp47 family protein [Methylobacterium thuringiense]|uniref:Baseplate J-like central domain-containing protein n=1 Tax=Methylobacterium thuringiense TaxID=1003091 RepID=A0ABQ4TJ85_9HYPH|nr:baseplate J/gp47 family protein [Methylobacterium thuringiense]GJE54587.1 hypothetical protein EKPJFOCH_1065 [Methylobacterium thuringiense]